MKMIRMHLFFCLFTAFIFTSNLVAEPHKIIYLISPPRSLSVAFTRMMQQRGDCAILHEPHQFMYCRDYASKWVHVFKGDSFQTGQELREHVLKLAEDKHVFLKEMSFALKPFLLDDREWIACSDVHFVFLVRNPHHSIISWYKRNPLVFDEGYSYVCGYKPLYELFQEIAPYAKNKLHVIYTEDLYTNPEKTVKAFCDAVGIAYMPEALEWQDLGESFTGDAEWHELKHPEHTQYWHGAAIRSSHFGSPSLYEVDERGVPTFSEIENEEHRAAIRTVYEENLRYYRLFKEAVENEGAD